MGRPLGGWGRPLGGWGRPLGAGAGWSTGPAGNTQLWYTGYHFGKSTPQQLGGDFPLVVVTMRS